MSAMVYFLSAAKPWLALSPTAAAKMAAAATFKAERRSIEILPGCELIFPFADLDILFGQLTYYVTALSLRQVQFFAESRFTVATGRPFDPRLAMMLKAR